MAKTKQVRFFVIQIGGEFLTRTLQTSNEYPDAYIFESLNKCNNIARQLTDTSAYEGKLLEVYKNYGFDDEQLVYSYNI